MRHLLFIIGLLSTASTGQEKAPLKGPILPPPNQQTNTTEALPVPPLPAPVQPAATSSAQIVNTVFLKDLEAMKSYVPKTFDKTVQDRIISIKRGEMKAILKIAAGIPAYLHGRDYQYTPATEQDGSFRLAITDKSLKLEIAVAIFLQDGSFKEISVNPENMKKVIESEKNPYANWGLNDSLERLASMARFLVGHEGYSTLALEGEMEFLMMNAMYGDKPELRARESYSVHEPKTGRNYFYHVIVLRDKATQQTRGVIGFFHSNQQGYPLVDLITSVGPRAVSKDVVQTFMQRIQPNQQNSQVRR